MVQEVEWYVFKWLKSKSRRKWKGNSCFHPLSFMGALSHPFACVSSVDAFTARTELSPRDRDHLTYKTERVHWLTVYRKVASPWTGQLKTKRLYYGWIFLVCVWFALVSVAVSGRDGLPGGAGGEEPPCQYRRRKRLGFSPWVWKIPWRRKGQPTPVFLPGESPRTEEPGGLQSMGATKSQT